MKYSQLFGKTRREAPRDEVSTNAKLLIRGGFVRREISGVYNFLPLGLRVLNKISNIVRDEMNKAGGQELLLSSLQNKESWEKTGRWGSFDALFKIQSRNDSEYALGPTHEEVLVPLVRQFVSSYRDLPLSLYQIQTKFRDEARAKSGILRGREFLMKDLYSFHADEEDFNKYYEAMKKAYKSVFERCGLKAIETRAGGGTFSQFSHEYQVVSDAGEDTILYCGACGFSENEEIASMKAGQKCQQCNNSAIGRASAIEVGNIFPLKTKFSEVFGLTYKDKNGKDQPVVMGCYGIGISRLMGTIVEVHHDARGIMWPSSVSPYDVHLIHLGGGEANTSEVDEQLTKAGVEVLYDDRDGVSAGEKLADADLIGIPVRLVVSDKTLQQSSGQAGDKVEWKKRNAAKIELLSTEEIIKRLK